MTTFSEKVVLVTGASGGLGSAISEAFHREGARLILCARNPERLDALKDHLGGDDDRILTVSADVSREEDVKALFRKGLERFGTVDVLINNAGFTLLRRIGETTLEEWNEIMGVHATGTFLCSRAAARHWLQIKGRGKIVNISSVSARMGSPLASAYSAAKAAVLGFTRAMARELAPKGINVNAICPGAIDTDMFHKGTVEVMADLFKTSPSDLVAATLSAIPLQRLLAPSEVADLTLYLASSKADGIVGQSFTISCGYHIQ